MHLTRIPSDTFLQTALFPRSSLLFKGRREVSYFDLMTLLQNILIRVNGRPSSLPCSLKTKLSIHFLPSHQLDLHDWSLPSSTLYLTFAFQSVYIFFKPVKKMKKGV